MITTPKIKLINTATFRGSDRWKWDIWLEGPDSELDRIENVEYVLHPTFPKRFRMVADRATKFKLSSSGWGEFMIHAKVMFNDGTSLPLNHWLKLQEIQGHMRQDPAKVELPSIYLSYSQADRPIAAILLRHLAQRGLAVTTQEDIAVSESISAAIRNQIAQADLVIALIAKEPSRWVLYEVEEALRQQVATLPVLLGVNVPSPSSIENIHYLRLENADDEAGVIKAIERQLENFNF